MRKSLLKLVGVAGLAVSTSVYALGLGGINVSSSLGQPLKADVELTSVTKAERGAVNVRLASPEMYRSAGLEYPQNARFKFQVDTRADGSSVVKITTDQPVNDPYVSIMLELVWSSGRMLREYTFLLDPPGYTPEQPALANVQTVAPTVGGRKHSSSSSGKSSSSTQTSVRASTGSAGDASSSAAGEHTAGSVKVQPGDSLNKIAAKHKPVEVSLDRMLVALYRANVQQFDYGNMNRIKVGKILRLPERPELEAVTDAEAMGEIRTHSVDWHNYRQKVAGAAVASQQVEATHHAATGKVSGSVADGSATRPDAKEVLRLSKGDAPGDKNAPSSTHRSVAEQVNAAQEEAIAKNKLAEEAKMRADLLEKNIKDMELLAKLKAEASGGASSVAAASQVAAASAPAVEVPKVKPAQPAKPAEESSSTDDLGRLLEEPIYLGGIAAVLLGLGGLAVMFRRRKRFELNAFKDDDSVVRPPKLTVPKPPSPDTGDFTATHVAAVASVATEEAIAEDVDPISEADLFLNFGRDVQAEEILKDALRKTPNNTQIHLKLLGIYAARKDENSFSGIARQLKPIADDPTWLQAAAMGRKVDPGNPMYDGDELGTIEDAGSATMQTTVVMSAMPDFVLDEMAPTQKVASPEIDFDLGDAFSAPAEVATPPVAESKSDVSEELAPGLDFDLTAESPEPVVDVNAPLDFDITGTNFPPLQTTPPAPELAVPHLDFDAEASQKIEVPETPAEPEATADSLDVDFSLDFPEIPSSAEPVVEEKPAAAKAMELEMMGLSLDFDMTPETSASAAAPAEESKPAESAVRDEKWHEVATKLDLAKAYQEMGDAVGAKEILEEVLREGDAEQIELANSMMSQLG